MGQSLLGNNRANISQCPRKLKSESLLLRLKHFTMFESPKMQRAGQRPVCWVNIPITRTVNNMMANMVEELQQQQQPQHHQSPKRVRWSEELTQVRDISPRYKASPFRFISPNRNNNNNRSASPSRSSSVSRSSSSSSSRPSKSSITSTTQLHCSPQLQKVVFRAVNNNESNSNNYWGSPSKTDSWRLNDNNNDSSWRPDRSHLSLNIRPTFV